MGAGGAIPASLAGMWPRRAPRPDGDGARNAGFPTGIIRWRMVREQVVRPQGQRHHMNDCVLVMVGIDHIRCQRLVWARQTVGKSWATGFRTGRSGAAVAGQNAQRNGRKRLLRHRVFLLEGFVRVCIRLHGRSGALDWHPGAGLARSGVLPASCQVFTGRFQHAAEGILARALHASRMSSFGSRSGLAGLPRRSHGGQRTRGPGIRPT